MPWHRPACWSLVLLASAVVSVALAEGAKEGKQSSRLRLRLPAEYNVSNEDAYLCMAVTPSQYARTIVGIDPYASQDVVHHMLLFGCEDAPPDGQVYDCAHHSICTNGQSSVFYGWGNNATSFALPHGVGFGVAGIRGMQRIVLQVHYLDGKPAGDESGVDLVYSTELQPRVASTVALAPYFEVPPGEQAFKVDVSCCVEGFQRLTPLSYRVHTHALGRDVSMRLGSVPISDPRWKTSALETEARRHEDLQVEVASRDPQLPQTFVPFEAETPAAAPGSHLQVTCTYDSSNMTSAVRAGFGHGDEMCNLYMMVASEQQHYGWCTNDAVMRQLQDDAPTIAFPLNMPITFANASGYALDVGPISGVALDPNDGSLWLFVRHDKAWGVGSFSAGGRLVNDTLIAEPAVYNIDPVSAKVNFAWGADTFAMPHGITVDWSGDVWLTDVGLHQVFKYSRAGEQLAVFGARFEGGEDLMHFCMPTDVAVLPSGEVFVSDGYCNARVAQLNVDAQGAASQARSALTATTPSVANTSDELPVIHGVAVNGCRRTVTFVARETAQVYAARVDSFQETAAPLDLRGIRSQLKEDFRVMSVRTGPYGDTFALIQTGEWSNGTSYLVNLDTQEHLIKLGGARYPHDFAFASLPPFYAARVVSTVVYVTETPPVGSDPPARLKRYILLSTLASPASAKREKERAAKMATGDRLLALLGAGRNQGDGPGSTGAVHVRHPPTRCMPPVQQMQALHVRA